MKREIGNSILKHIFETDHNKCDLVIFGQIRWFAFKIKNLINFCFIHSNACLLKYCFNVCLNSKETLHCDNCLSDTAF